MSSSDEKEVPVVTAPLITVVGLQTPTQTSCSTQEFGISRKKRKKKKNVQDCEQETLAGGIESHPGDVDVKDQDVAVAFKKLRVDIEGNSQDDPTKVDASPPQPENSTTSSDDQLCETWNRSMTLCFCQRIKTKQGKTKIKYCKYHEGKNRSRVVTPESFNDNLNLVYVALSHRPLLQDSRLNCRAEKKPTRVLRSPKFNFKPAKLAEANSSLASISESEKADQNEPVVGDGQPSTTPKKASSESASCSTAAAEKDKSEPSKDETGASPSAALFTAGAASKDSVSFSSLCPKSGAAPERKDKEPEVFRFEGYRANPHNVSIRPQPVQSCENHASSSGTESVQPSSGFDSLSDIIQALPQQASSPPRALERSCSQEARSGLDETVRLDESELNVNELASYLENSLFMPKAMSSMAQMMYT